MDVGSWRVRHRLSTTHEVHDFNFIPLANHRRREPVALDDREVVLDGDSAGINLQLLEELQDRELAGELERITVEANFQILPHGTATPKASRIASIVALPLSPRWGGSEICGGGVDAACVTTRR